MKYIVDIKGEIEGDYEIIGKYEERPIDEITKEQAIDALHHYGWLVVRSEHKAVERPKGEWINESQDSLLCTCCKKRVYKPFIGGFPTERSQYYYPNFCAFCGADMRKGGQEK